MNDEENEDEAIDAKGEVQAEQLDQSVEQRPRMSKTERAALHAAQPHRTALLPSHPLLHDKLLPLWETARRAELGKEERKKAVADLWDIVKGRVGEVSRGHKGGRVLQTVRQLHAMTTRLMERADRQIWREGGASGGSNGAATSMAGYGGVQIFQGAYLPSHSVFCSFHDCSS